MPPPIRYGDENLPGQAVLEEDLAGAGGELWHMLRAVQLWARSAREPGMDLFVPDAGAEWESAAPGEIHDAVSILRGMLNEPDRAGMGGVSEACRAIAVWADQSGAAGTALEFAQVRAELDPADALAAHLVGRFARRRGESVRAESWLRHAVYLGRASRDLTAYARANLGLGNLFAERGSLPAARRVFLRTLRAARRAKSGEIAAMALHDLFQVAAQRGQVDAATRYAGAAARRYGAGHDRLAVLYKDLAFLWVESGLYEPALRVLLALRPLVDGIPERRLLHSATARAAAGVWDEGLFDTSVADLDALPGSADVGEAVAPALLNLARGAVLLDREEEARRFAARAVAAARVTREGKIRIDAEDLLERLAGRTGPPPVRADASGEAPKIATLAREAVNLLAGAAG